MPPDLARWSSQTQRSLRRWQNWDRVQRMDNPVGYLYRVGRTAALRAVDHDARSASATVDIQVEYIDYSADGCSFLNGAESVVVDGLDYTWTADLEVTGCHQGSLLADVQGVAFPASATGTIVTQYDGVSREGLPGQ